MEIETLGHASLLLSSDDRSPLLLTDPWLVESVYWRSWWLENYPDAPQIQRLRSVKYCYITHEHPDHFHMPSLEVLGHTPEYFSPTLPEPNIVQILSEKGFKAAELPSLSWRRLTDDVRILPVWLWNDDSILLIDTPTALILNLNDTRPQRSLIRLIERFRAASGKQLVVLSSYSPASIVNSFRRNGAALTIKRKSDYVQYVNSICGGLQADWFMPFASQAVFLRSDSQWANAFRVTYADLKAYWTSKTRLVPPFCRLDLRDWSYSAVAESAYRTDGAHALEQIAEQEALDRNCLLDDKELSILERQLNATWFVYALIYGKGILFDTRSERFMYRPWRRKLARVERVDNFAFRLTVPAQALKDAINFGHVGDLGIAMFTTVELKSVRKPWMVYGFLDVETFKDYKHASSVKAFLRWLRPLMNSQWHLRRRVPALRSDP